MTQSAVGSVGAGMVCAEGDWGARGAALPRIGPMLDSTKNINYPTIWMKYKDRARSGRGR